VIYLSQNTTLEETLNIIKLNFENKSFKVTNVKKIEYGVQFIVSLHNWSELIRIYQNKKGDINYDLSQIKNPENYKIIEKILEFDNPSSINTNYTENFNNRLGFPIIGTDESGKGDYFGPLVAAGILIDESIASRLRSLEVKDSKLLKDHAVTKLSSKIKEICTGKFSIIEISPDTYNELYEQFRREDKNLNTLLAWGHAKAIEEILSRNICYKAISDQLADEKYILSKLQERGKLIDLIQMPKAEQNIAVAAASIIARDRYLEKLAKLSKEFKVDLPKGASQNVIEAGKLFVERHGEEKLRKVAKLHFKTTKQIIERKH